MWRLVTTELLRLRWRRAVAVLLGAAVLVPALVFAGEAWNTRPISAEDRREAQAEIDVIVAGNQQAIDDCIAHPQDFGVTADPPHEECELAAAGVPSVDEWIYRPQLDLAGVREGAGLAVISILALIAGLIGTTFVGHDWASGSMSNQLLFEPRRGRVWLAKGIAVLLTGLVVAAVVTTAFWTGMWALAEARDVTTTSGTWADILGTQLRGSVFVALVGLLGYGLTTLFRSTVGALGLMLGASVVSSILIATIIGAGSERWLLPTNAFAVVLDGYSYYDPTLEPCFDFGDCRATLELTHGVVYLGTILVAVVALSVWSFRRRDVP